MQYSSDVVVAVEPTRVYPYVADLARYVEWMPMVHGVEAVDDGVWNVELRAKVGVFARSKRLRMKRTVNTSQVVANWLIGREIVEEEQLGNERAEYGKFLIKKLSQLLKISYGSGFSMRQLEFARKFYRVYPIAQTLSAFFQILYKKASSVQDFFWKILYQNLL